MPEISLFIWNLCCKPQGTSRRAGFRHGDAFCQPLQLPEAWSWFGLLLCVTDQPVLEFQLPPALPRGSTSLSLWAPGIILFHPPQDSSMEWVKTRSLDWCLNRRCAVGLHDLIISPYLMSMLSSASRCRGASWTFVS